METGSEILYNLIVYAKGVKYLPTPAERIQKYIKEKGIKQKHISNKTGINDSTLSAKLKGKTRLTADDIELICHALGCTPSEFIIARSPGLNKGA